MEIVVNPLVLFADVGPEFLSASQAELGSNAGQITWQNCLKLAEEQELPGLDYSDAKDHFRDYGAWDSEEIDAWTDVEVRAMVIQEIAADYRYQTESGAQPDQVRHVLDHNGLMYCYFGV